MNYVKFILCSKRKQAKFSNIFQTIWFGIALCIICLNKDVNCVRKSTNSSTYSSVASSKSKSTPIMATSRSLHSGSVVDVHDSSDLLLDNNAESSLSLGSKNSKYFQPSPLASSSSLGGSSSGSGIASAAASGSNSHLYSPYSYDYYETMPYTYSSSGHPYKFYNPAPESSVSRRQMRYIMPDHVGDYMQSLPTNSFGSVPSYNSLSAYYDKNRDLDTASTSHEHHGHGWKKGWKPKHTSYTTHTDYKVSAVNTDAIGLLGLLGLLSLFQFALFALATTTAAARKKRDLGDSVDDNDTNPNSHHLMLTRMVLPHLNVVAHARQGTMPLACAPREVCLVNKLLKKELGWMSHLLGQQLSGAMKNLLLERLDETSATAPTTLSFENSAKYRLANAIDIASQNGLAENDCESLYPVCHEMRDVNNGVIVYPRLLLNNEQQKNYL